ncbi:hypothetical protein TYRP_021170 [Tyrophagus putrescentiae]|nr:hypothetical protein TYRP_021170 [Tyrophagus putrescentiae]
MNFQGLFSFFVLVVALICSTMSGVAEAGKKGGDVIIIGGGGGGGGGGFGGFGNGFGRRRR